jgi:DNA polymerase-3 subunit delta'
MLKHHAYLYRVQNVESKEIASFIKTLEVEDVDYFQPEPFGIDDVRELTTKAFSRPTSGSTKLIVVLLKSITVEAQQALLKLLEEPPKSTAFVFCVPHSLYLLPTLLSRFYQPSGFERIANSNSTFSEFCALNLADRFAEISDRLLKKDKALVDELKQSLVNWLVAKPKNLKNEDIAWYYYIAEHLQTRGASNKMLLEELALSIGPAAEKS